jgi:hypothetical protein
MDHRETEVVRVDRLHRFLDGVEYLEEGAVGEEDLLVTPHASFQVDHVASAEFQQLLGGACEKYHCR